MKMGSKLFIALAAASALAASAAIYRSAVDGGGRRLEVASVPLLPAQKLEGRAVRLASYFELLELRRQVRRIGEAETHTRIADELEDALMRLRTRAPRDELLERMLGGLLHTYRIEAVLLDWRREANLDESSLARLRARIRELEKVLAPLGKESEDIRKALFPGPTNT